MSNPEENTEPSNDRTNGKDPATGRFQKGNKIAKGGDPHASKVKAFRSAFIAAVSADDIEAITKKAVQQAREGDRAAREFVFDRLMGKPTQHVEATVESTGIVKTYMGLDINEV